MVSLPTWSQAVLPPGTEFSTTSLPIISGAIPSGLRGTLYRNGPARLERGDRRVGHWFDGDGAVLAVNFSDAETTGTYRFVRTKGYCEEEKAGTLLYGNYGMLAPGPFWRRWTKPIKNAANISVLPLEKEVLALWEGGKPYALDRRSLETLETEDLGGLEGDLGYSAHPTTDPDTGEIFNFYIQRGRNGSLELYKSQADGTIVQRSSTPLDGLPLVHDFVFVGQYLVFFIPPVRIEGLSMLLGLSAYKDAMKWKPDLGTEILIFDRQTLHLVSRSRTETWYQWHFANGYIDDTGNIIVDFVRYDDFPTTNLYLEQVASGRITVVPNNLLYRATLDPQTGEMKQLEQLCDRHCEFPTVAPDRYGKKHDRIYFSVHRQGVDRGREIFGAIAYFDIPTQTLVEYDFGENRYPMEPIFAPDSSNPSQGWVLTILYDGNRDRSEVWIFEGDRLDGDPVCRLELPEVIPIGFHGAWQPG